jgi:hypothetical protein
MLAENPDITRLRCKRFADPLRRGG